MTPSPRPAILEPPSYVLGHLLSGHPEDIPPGEARYLVDHIHALKALARPRECPFRETDLGCEPDSDFDVHTDDVRDNAIAELKAEVERYRKKLSSGHALDCECQDCGGPIQLEKVPE